MRSRPKIFSGKYAYFSSFSTSWLEHARRFSQAMIERMALGNSSKVVEIASNDGYLLKNFVEAGIPCLGVEPARNVAAVAISAGIPTEMLFLGPDTAASLVAAGHAADLLVANNVLAHVPDLNGFVRGLKLLLKPGGVVSIECPHLLNLINNNQFDTIYHEHYSYFSLRSLEKILAAAGLVIFDAAELPTHGGSLRVFACHAGQSPWPPSGTLEKIRDDETRAGFDSLAGYAGFATSVRDTCGALLDFLHDAKSRGKKVAAYGAPAKGNTLLNVCGIKDDLVAFTVDKNPEKQGHYLPGSRIPVHAPDKILSEKPDFVLVLPWNIADEVIEQMHAIRVWGGKFVTAIPHLKIHG